MAEFVLIVYGIPHCDTVQRACDWFDAHGIAYELHDLRKEHIDARTIEHWIEVLGKDRLVNKASATWRTLDRGQREQVEEGNPVPVLLANPTLIKRPVLVGENLLHCGFDSEIYERLFASA